MGGGWRTMFAPTTRLERERNHYCYGGKDGTCKHRPYRKRFSDLQTPNRRFKYAVSVKYVVGANIVRPHPSTAFFDHILPVSINGFPFFECGIRNWLNA